MLQYTYFMKHISFAHYQESISRSIPVHYLQTSSRAILHNNTNLWLYTSTNELIQIIMSNIPHLITKKTNRKSVQLNHKMLVTSSLHKTQKSETFKAWKSKKKSMLALYYIIVLLYYINEQSLGQLIAKQTVTLNKSFHNSLLCSCLG